MRRFIVERPKDTVEVIIVRNKIDDTFSFVNLSKGHICSCRFASEDDAIADMEQLKSKGEIIKYTEL